MGQPRIRTHQALDVRVLAGLVVLGIVVYGQVGGFAFLGMDDSQYLTENPWVRRGLSWDGLMWALTNTRIMYWHPVTWLSFMAEVELFGVDPVSAHLINLGLHVLNAFLVYGIARRARLEALPAALAASLFLVHPLQAESVAWVAERKTLLCGLFAFLSVLAYLDVYAPRPSIGRYALVTGLYALAMAAKPAAGPLPFVLLALDAWPLGRLDGRRRCSIAEKLPLLLVGLVLSHTALAGMETAGIRISSDFVPWPRRVQEAVAALGAFLSRAVVPADLSFWYPSPKHLARATWSGAVIGVGLLGAAWACRRKRPIVCVGLLWYLMLLAPGLGLERGGAWPFAADRFQYLALPGLWIALVEACRALMTSRVARTACACATLAGLGGVTWIQVSHWRDTRSLMSYAVSVDPGNIQALNELGILLAQDGRVEEAAVLFRKALARSPCYLKARNNLCLAWIELGDLSRALEEAEALLACRPDDSQGLLLKARLLVRLGRGDEATAACERVSELAWEDPGVLAECGRIALHQGNPDTAARLLRRAVRARPARPGPVLRDLGAALLVAGRDREAERVLRHALETRTADPDVLANLGLSVARQGRCGEAERLLLQALSIDPRHRAARANLEGVRTGALCGQGEP